MTTPVSTGPAKPAMRPARPEFSSGPCAKRPGWASENLRTAILGRSHRSKPGKARLQAAIDRTRDVLEVPADYLIGITPGSDTGALEMALWSLLGPRPVQLLAFESFGKDWVTDVVKELKIPAEVLSAPYGALPDLSRVSPDADLVFTWNGTTSGVRVPDGRFIAGDRAGLTICDATSACFAQQLDWPKLDVVTFSWQKALGGEAAHGMLILSPRAVARLESHTPAWPIPKIFRMTSGGKLITGIFEGDTINTPSMLCVEDQLDALIWAESIGGLPALIGRSQANLAALEAWVSQSDWAAFLAGDKATRSSTSICLVIKAPWFQALSRDEQTAAAKSISARLEKEGAAFDVMSYRDTPPGLRLWGGATIEPSDMEKVTPWLDWAYAEEVAARA